MRHADLGTLRRSLQFGCANVRPAAQQIRGHADDDFPGSRGNLAGRAGKQEAERLGSYPEQHAERIQPLLQLDCQLRHRRLCRAQHVFRLVDVEHGCGAALVPVAGDGKNPALLDNVLAGDRDLLLKRADADISARDITEKRHEDIIIRRNRGQISRIARFNPAPKFPPKIQLPCRLDADPIGPEIGDCLTWRRTGLAGARRRTGLSIGLAQKIIAYRAQRRLFLRPELANRNAQLGAGFEHFGAGAQ